MKKIRLIMLLVAAAAVTSQAAVIRYGGIEGKVDAGQIVRDTTATGNDLDVTWTGASLHKGIQTADGTLGDITGLNAGPTTQITDTLTGSNVVLTATSATAKIGGNNGGQFFSVIGGAAGSGGEAANNVINGTEQVVLSFNQNMIFHNVRIFNNGNYGNEGDTGNVIINGTTYSGIVSSTSTPNFIDLGGVVANEITIGGGVNDGTWSIEALTVETIPEPAAIGLIASCAGGLLFIRRRFMI